MGGSIVRRFGNLTAASVAEVLVSARPYNEQGAESQRSVKSTSANDADPGGSGAKIVRISYLDSNYAEFTEDVALNGLTAVATVGTNIRFIQDFKVVKGAAAAGAVELWSANNGTGTAICGIGTGTEQAFFCHHYVPAGWRAFLTGWGAVVDDEASLKFKAQARYGAGGADLVDINADLERLFNGNLTPPNRLAFDRTLGGVQLGERTYLRVTVVPNQATSTVVRSYMYLFLERLVP